MCSRKLIEKYDLEVRTFQSDESIVQDEERFDV